jgi:hypothetical protein
VNKLRREKLNCMRDLGILERRWRRPH